MDEFMTSIVLSGDEIVFLHSMCQLADNLPRKVRRKIGPNVFDHLHDLTHRLSLQVNAYNAYLKHHKEEK